MFRSITAASRPDSKRNWSTELSPTFSAIFRLSNPRTARSWGTRSSRFQTVRITDMASVSLQQNVNKGYLTRSGNRKDGVRYCLTDEGVAYVRNNFTSEE